VPNGRDLYGVSGAVVFIEPSTGTGDAARATGVPRPVSALDEVRADGALSELILIDMSTAVYAMYMRRALLLGRAALKRLALAFGEFLFSFHSPHILANDGRK